jgi:hypothetical protein
MPAPPLLGAGHVSLAAACGLASKTDVDHRRAAVMLETAYSTLLLELCWIAFGNDPAAVAALATTTATSGSGSH